MNSRDARIFVLACDVFLFLMMLVVGLALGCASAGFRGAHATIPKQCMHSITVDDFTKPCNVIPGKPNEALCDKVHIRFACLDYTK